MIRAAVAYLGAKFIYALIWLFGRTHRRADIEWLMGPTGGDHIGDAPYRDVAEREGLALERSASDGGLVPDFHQLDGPSFDAERAHPLVREFYEHTTRFTMDVWSRTFFPASIGMWLLVTTISRQVDQLNFPLSPLDTARGMASEIILLRRSDGTVRYTGWFRTLTAPTRVLYTGFYMTARVPGEPGPCVKVVFPMPRGNATVILRAALEPDGSLVLDSRGGKFGGAGFYRLQLRDDERVRVWKVRTLHERFHIHVDPTGTLRCDHSVRFLGLPVLRLHFKMSKRALSESSAAA